MTVNIIDLIVLSLAATALLRLWLRGSIFNGVRARLEVTDTLWAKGLTCDLCLSYHAAFWLTLCWLWQSLDSLQAFEMLIVTSLAVTTLSFWMFRLEGRF